MTAGPRDGRARGCLWLYGSFMTGSHPWRVAFVCFRLCEMVKEHVDLEQIFIADQITFTFLSVNEWIIGVLKQTYAGYWQEFLLIF